MVAVALGVLVWTGALSWFGRLPGDLSLGGERWRVSVPLASMVVVSVLLTIAVNLLLRWFD